MKIQRSQPEFQGVLNACQSCERCSCLHAGTTCPTCGNVTECRGLATTTDTLEHHMNYNEIAQLAHDAVLHTLMVNGERHGDAWKTTSDGKNATHAIEHLRKHLASDTTESHLKHALTRVSLIMAKKQLELLNEECN